MRTIGNIKKEQTDLGLMPLVIQNAARSENRLKPYTNDLEKVFRNESLNHYNIFNSAYKLYSDMLINRCKTQEDIGMLLDSFWGLFANYLDNMKNSIGVPKLSLEIFPMSLKNKLTQRIDLNKMFIMNLLSTSPDPWAINDICEELSTEEEKLLWQVFHRKFTVCSNRVFKGKNEIAPMFRERIICFIESAKRPVKVLELGCGPRANTIKQIKQEFNSKVIAYGIDKEIYDLSDADVSLTEGDARAMPYKDNTFDYIYEFAVSEYFQRDEEWKELLSEVLRVLKPQGEFIFAGHMDCTKDLSQLITDVGIKHRLINGTPCSLKKY